MSVAVRFTPVAMLAAVLILLPAPVGTEGTNEAPEPVVREQESGARVEVVPTVELISGVLSRTSWAEEFGPHSGAGEYFSSLSGLFAAHDEHPAMHKAESLIDRGFRHDAFPNLAMRLRPDEELSVRHPYDRSLAARGGGVEELEGFRHALADLAKEADFFAFFADNRGRYESMVEEIAAELPAESLVRWMEEFYGWSGDAYITVLAPAMYPSGGYGGQVVTAGGDVLMLNVIRAADEAGPVRFPAGERLAGLALHEWGHSYVDPTLADFSSEVVELQSLFEPVESQMREQEYGNVFVFTNEQVLRAVCALAMRDLYGEAAYERDIASNEQRGFYLTAHLAQFIEKEYRGNRDRYETFSDFAPDLLHELSQVDPDEFSTRRWPITPGAVRPLFLGAVVLIAAIWWLVVGLRRRRQQIREMDEDDEIYWE